jgi:hypothetical protein
VGWFGYLLHGVAGSWAGLRGGWVWGGGGGGGESGELNSGCERGGGGGSSLQGGGGVDSLEIFQFQSPSSAEIIQSLRRPVRN